MMEPYCRVHQAHGYDSTKVSYEQPENYGKVAKTIHMTVRMWATPNTPNETVQADTEIAHEFNVERVKLSMISQSQAYGHIWAVRKIKEQESSHITVQQILVTVTSINGVEPTPSRLWTSLHHKDVSRPIQGFLWKAIKTIFKIGTFQECLGPQYAIREKCPNAGYKSPWNTY